MRPFAVKLPATIQIQRGCPHATEGDMLRWVTFLAAEMGCHGTTLKARKQVSLLTLPPMVLAPYNAKGLH